VAPFLASILTLTIHLLAQVLYQMRILLTALFLYFALGKVLTRVQWLALCLLGVGISIVQAFAFISFKFLPTF
jgi:hypothetical protein